MNTFESILDDPSASFEEQMKVLLKGAAEAKKRGPPPVYSATLPLPAETWYSYRLFHERTINLNKNVDDKANKKMTVQTTMLPAIEHGIAPNVDFSILRNQMTLREIAEKVNFLHKGKCLFVKTVFDPCKIVATSTLVQDDSGDYMSLSLYNFDRHIPKGSLLLLLEPYMRNGQDNPESALMLRCDNPQCILMYDSQDEWEAAKEARYPNPDKKSSPNSLRSKGNTLFEQQDFESAKKAYEKAIRSEDVTEADMIACLSILAETCLRLEQFEHAERFANRLLQEFDAGHLKGRFRRAKALLYLNRPREARQLLDSLLQSKCHGSTKKLYRELSREVDRCLKEHENGVYDFESMRKEATRGMKVFHADYMSPSVEFGVNITMNKTEESVIRGCQANTDIAAGTLLCACKAFAFIPEDGALTTYCNPFTGEFGTGKDIEVVSQCIRKILMRPQLGEKLYKLSAGKNFHADVSDSSKLDIPRIRSIIHNNAFKGGQDVGLRFDVDVARSEREDQVLRQLNEEEMASLSRDFEYNKGTGLWVQASFFNHSCTPNCVWWNIGDHLFVFTQRPVSVNQELCISYIAADITFKERTEKFQKWISPKEGFTCVCKVCAIMRDHPDLCDLEKEVESAFMAAAKKVQAYNSDMGAAAEASLSSSRRAHILETFSSWPFAVQRQSVRKTLILNGTCLSQKGLREEACQAFEQAALVCYACRGMTPDNDYPQDLWRIVGASMDCGRQENALRYLREAYQCIRHAILGATPHSSKAVRKLNRGFQVLTRKYASPFWVQLRGNPAAMMELDNLCGIVSKEKFVTPGEPFLEKRLKETFSSFE